MTARGAALGGVSHHRAKPQRGDPNVASTHDSRDRVNEPTRSVAPLGLCGFGRLQIPGLSYRRPVGACERLTAQYKHAAPASESSSTADPLARAACLYSRPLSEFRIRPVSCLQPSAWSTLKSESMGTAAILGVKYDSLPF
jgi:hypothetical protein